MAHPNSILEFWEERAKHLEKAGTNDLLAKQLEIEAIANYLRDGMHVLDVGCGNGVTAIELARRFRIQITGLDFAAEMIAAGTRAQDRAKLKGTLRFQVADIRDPLIVSAHLGRYDLVYTERVLINLADWPSQRRAIVDIASFLKVGGLYVMCENSQDGLGEINNLREMVGLYRIEPPWHNRYLRDSEINSEKFDTLELEQVVHYGSTYYFLSRIVNAALAATQGTEPDYLSLINQLALRLPPLFKFGQGRIWLWRKIGS